MKKYHGKDPLQLVRHLEVFFMMVLSSHTYFDVHCAYFYLISLQKKNQIILDTSDFFKELQNNLSSFKRI